MLVVKKVFLLFKLTIQDGNTKAWNKIICFWLKEIKGLSLLSRFFFSFLQLRKKLQERKQMKMPGGTTTKSKPRSLSLSLDIGTPTDPVCRAWVPYFGYSVNSLWSGQSFMVNTAKLPDLELIKGDLLKGTY